MPRKKKLKTNSKKIDSMNPPTTSHRSAVRSKAVGCAARIDDLTNNMDSVRLEDMTSRDLCEDIYSTINFHEDFLKDKHQIHIYRQAICGNKHLFRDKVVLDVNCGLGILSLFATKAGAKHVYSIDTSNITQLTKQIVHDNNLDHAITVIRGSIETIELPVEQVDVIITYFRGNIYSFEESLLVILAARDKWLRPDGLILPDSCSLHINATNETRYHDNMCDYWMNVYDFQMCAIQNAVLREPFGTRVHNERVVSDPCKLRSLDFYSITKSDLQTFDSIFRLCTRGKTNITALFVYFDVGFSKCHIPLVLSMAPNTAIVHWKPTVFLLPYDSICHSTAQHEFYGVFRFVSNSNDNNIFDFLIDLCIRNEMITYKERYVYQLR